MHDITGFSLKDMVECSKALREVCRGADSMRQAATRVVDFLQADMLDGRSGRQAFVMTRLFKTHPWDELDEELRSSAAEMMGGPPERPDTKCLTLLASAGVEDAWWGREGSPVRRVIPLASESFVEEFPMVRQLIQQLGLEVSTVLRPDPAVVADLAERSFNVFLVQDAEGSGCVLDQDRFVKEHGVRSVLGFGGMLPSGNLYAVILFSAVRIGRELAEMFKTLSLSVKISLLPFDCRAVFA
jgi:hypothetical protein